MSWKDHRWLLANTILEPGKGGISRVARMSVRALLEQQGSLKAFSLLDSAPVEIAGLASNTARGNRLAFTAHCHCAALTSDRFLYDAVGVARAHPRFPGLRKPYGVWIHGVEVWDDLHRDRERALRGADFVLVNSQFTLDRFCEIHGSLENAHVVRLATEENSMPAQAPFDGPPTALLIGRSDKDNFRKGHTEVVESWATVANAVPSARLLLAGGGDGLELLRETVVRSPARDTIDVLGFVPEDEMAALWARAHVFVQPSWKEGFGLVYIEAMRHGLPVIASVHDAGQEVNVDGETGYNVDLTRTGELATRLIHLLRETSEAQRLGQAGQKRWQKTYRFSAFRERLSQALDTCA